MKNFLDKQVLITGAGSGIGQATALALAQQGATLWLADINAKGLDITQALIEPLGIKSTKMLCDVADGNSVKAMAEQVHSQIDALDILINNAGIGCGGRFLDASLETWHKAIDINLMGVVHGCHYFLPEMVRRNQGGHVVNMASIAAYMASPDMPIYTASKYAVLGLSEALAADMAQYNIGVTAVCPGVINTAIIDNSIMEGKLQQSQTHTQIADFYRKRNYSPEQVARAILQGIKKNKAVLPVSPESWLMYYSKRLFPKLVMYLARKDLPFLK